MMGSELIEKLNWRYSAKRFDASRKLTASQWSTIEAAMVLSPSSYGLQPWKFLVIESPEIRKALRVVSWNQSQVEDCSHFVVFLAKSTITATDVERYVDHVAKVRKQPKEKLTGLYNSIVKDVVTGPRSQEVRGWTARQTYIALGQTMTAAAMLGIDTCPMEGLDPQRYDEILGLHASGYYTACALAIGFRHPDDWLAKEKKVRFDTRDVVQFR
jgi:nitroreductase